MDYFSGKAGGVVPITADTTGSFPGFCMRHRIFSSKILGFENTTIHVGPTERGGLAERSFRIAGGMI